MYAYLVEILMQDSCDAAGYMFRIKPAAETDSEGGDAALAGDRLLYEPVNTRDVAQVPPWTVCVADMVVHNAFHHRVGLSAAVWRPNSHRTSQH